MKKTIVFLSAFILSVGGAIVSPIAWKNSLPRASITEIKKINYKDYVSASGELYVKGDNAIVTALVSENNIYKVKEGQKAVITGNAFPDNSYDADVISISGTAVKSANGAVFVPVEIKLSETDENIRSGYSVKAKILSDDEKEISVLPYEVIKADEDGNEFVYVLNSGVAVRKDIETGLETKEGVEITDGIDENDCIIYGDDEIENGKYIVIGEE